VLNDFEACARVCAPDAVIYFHDADVVHPAISDILRRLKRARRRFTALKLDGLTCAIAMAPGGVLESAIVQGLARDGQAYLRAMRIASRVPACLKPVLRTVRAAFTRT
jgi:hypothetical protein